MTLQGHSGDTPALDWSPDGRHVVTASLDWTARVWEAATGRVVHTFKGHRDGLVAVAWSPDGRQIATSDWGTPTVKVWDAGSGRETLSLSPHPVPVRQLAWSPNSRRLLTASGNGTTRLLDAATGREVLTFPGLDYNHPSITFFPDGRRILTSVSREARIWVAARDEEAAAWAGEERAAEQSVAAALRERADRARAEGMIQDWLILAPVPLAGGESGPAVDREQLPNEARLRPRTGERVRLGDREPAWQEHHANDYFLDFNALLGQMTENTAAYAVCYLECDTEQTGLELRVGCDDHARVYLNGREVYCYRGPARMLRYDQDRVSGLALRRGTNVLVFKVVNEQVDWKGCLRLVYADGTPVRGVKVTLSPDGE
jgi:hypothetical protein